MFDDLDCHINTFNGTRNVIRNGQVLIKSVKKNGLYHVVGAPVFNVASYYVVSSACMNDDRTKLWHNRMRHIGNKGLHYLCTSGILNSKSSNLSACENCIFGKQTRNSFPKSGLEVSKPLEYVHANLWGPA